MIKIKEELSKITRQSNKFIEMCYKQEFSAIELKIIELIISKTTKADLELFKTNSNKKISLTAVELANKINIHPNNIYSIANDLSEKLINKNYIYKNPDEKRFIYQNFFVGFDYYQGVFNINLNSFFIPYFVDINENFTNINFQYIVALKSSYAIVLYKLLKQYQVIGERSFIIDELKSQFGVNNKKSYQLYSNFKNKVIKISIEHINKYTDLNIQFDEIKSGKKIEKINFIIQKKITQEKQAQYDFIMWARNEANNFLLYDLLHNKTIKEIDFNQPYIKESFDYFIKKHIKNYIPKSIGQLMYS